MKQRLILSPDDLESGTYCTVYAGAIEREICPAGGVHETERYAKIKGLGLHVQHISLPYVACQIVMGVLVIVDTRECQLSRVTREYYEFMAKAHGRAEGGN